MTSLVSRPGFPRRAVLVAGAALPLTSLGLVACSDGDGAGEVGEPDLAAEVPRADPGPAEGAGALAVPFTARLLGAVDRTEVNTVCSPLSAQVALTMAGLGAAGDTRAQMEEVLGGSIDELAATANTLSSVLAAIGDEAREEDEEDAAEPAVASLVNGTWLQEGMAVEEEFLGGLATHFGSGVYEVDFTDAGDREAGRGRINDWVADATNDLIQDLIPDGVLDESTRLVLVNALHLKAAWPQPLSTAGGTFTTAAGEETSAEMLIGTTSTWYEDDLCRATSLDTEGNDLALAVVQPAADLASVLDAWSSSAEDPGAGLAALLDGLEDSSGTTELTFPGFDIEWKASLKEILDGLGMTDAFTDAADFSGITSQEKLAVSAVLQKAVITVDEEGMEAAAATALGAGAVSAPADVHELVLDAPFLFVAYEKATRAPLVLGWIGDPTQTR
ncbi:serpin family protein [Brachybacterium sp. FME24]|uniref:serpin family protein n=1 Tax=Brachybacterium sp. FME24 TaxID=2742605 RepID=UPI0018664A37|nr:serpin family protein [Brachybacterium sp. FME24]